MLLIKVALCFLSLSFLLTDIARAASLSRNSAIIVTTLNDELNLLPSSPPNGMCSLREAIRAANTDSSVDSCRSGSYGNDLILIQGTGTITLNPGLGPLIIGSSLEIYGTSASRIRISGNNVTKVFRIDYTIPSTPPYVKITKVTISNGTDSYGGCITFRQESSLDLDYVIIENCRAGVGGAITNFDSGPFVSGSFLRINNSTLRNNTTTSSGGAIALAPHWACTAASGGNIYTTITNSTINNNTADGSGGGLYLCGRNNSVNIANTTISGNIAGNRGGALYQFTDPFQSVRQIKNSTIVHNSAGYGGGGLGCSAAGSVDFYSSIVALNTAVDPNTPDIDASGWGCVARSFNGGYNFIGINTGSGLTTTYSTDKIGSLAAPIDPLLLPLANNGGHTETHHPYLTEQAILSGVHVVDAGDRAGGGIPFSIIPYDQRGIGTLDLSLPNRGNGADIGAVEFYLSVVP